jgi:hypothetical protein
MDEPGHYETGHVKMTYTYLGQRKRNGRDEAVIALDGVVRKKGRDKDVDLTGNASGTALVDLATGRVSQAKTTVTIDMEVNITDPGEPGAKAESVRVLATLDVRLERN